MQDGGSRAKDLAAFRGNFEFVATAMCSSEGENITMNLGNFAAKIGKYCRETEQNELWVLLDAVDSGLSVDAIVDLKEYLFKTILESNSDKEVHIVVSANEYEMARGEKCFDVVQGKYVSIKSYEKYRSVVMRSRAEKDKRYEQ